jgi:hypothetical protein
MNQKLKLFALPIGTLIWGQECGGDLALRCEHCKKVGHQSDVCWFLHSQLRPIRARRQCFGSENDKRKGELLSDTREEGNRQKKSDAAQIRCGMDPFEQTKEVWCASVFHLQDF